MILNIFANILIVFGITFFISNVFGGKNKLVKNLPKTEKLFLKISLVLISFGSISNLLTFSSPLISEIILNLGFGILIVWAAFFIWKHFTERK